MKKALFNKTLSIAISPKVFEQVKKLTDDKNISIGEWVRDAMNIALDKDLALLTVPNADLVKNMDKKVPNKKSNHHNKQEG